MSESCLAQNHLKSNFNLSRVHPTCWHFCCVPFIPLAAATNTYIQGCNKEGTHWIPKWNMK